MSWRKIKLGECCKKIGSGSTPKGGERVYTSSGIAFIRSQNVYNLNFDYGGLVFINNETAQKLNGVTVKENDVLINITGDSVARTCIVPSDVLPARVNQHVSIIRPDSRIICPKFLNYYLASPFMQTFMLGLAVGKGASRNAITKSMIANFDVPYPPLETQQRIASILSAYDDLIDNNRRQIKLLEEAVQRLYKEWFVDLRFPGHENVKVVDGVPEGWRVGTLSEIAEFKRGKTITKAQVVNGDVPVVAGGLEPAYYHDKPNTTAPVITISGSGANAGFTKMYLENIFASDCSFVDIKGTQYLYFIFCYLQAHNVELTALQKGSAQPHVYAKDINSMKLTVPDAEILQQFCVYAGKFFDLIGKRERQKKFLSEARDRLLPKLISGEIEV